MFRNHYPQFLGHPKVKLFISHGGLLGTQEAIYCGIPTLGIPFFSDQFLNVKQSVVTGTSLQVNYQEITKPAVLTAVKSLMQDPK